MYVSVYVGSLFEPRGLRNCWGTGMYMFMWAWGISEHMWKFGGAKVWKSRIFNKDLLLKGLWIQTSKLQTSKVWALLTSNLQKLTNCSPNFVFVKSKVWKFWCPEVWMFESLDVWQFGVWDVGAVESLKIWKFGGGESLEVWRCGRRASYILLVALVTHEQDS